MRISSIKTGSKIHRRKSHTGVKISGVGASKGGTKLSPLPTASIDFEMDGRRYHMVIEATDFGIAELTDYLQDVVKNKPLK